MALAWHTSLGGSVLVDEEERKFAIVGKVIRSGTKFVPECRGRRLLAEATEGEARLAVERAAMSPSDGSEAA